MPNTPIYVNGVTVQAVSVLACTDIITFVHFKLLFHCESADDAVSFKYKLEILQSLGGLYDGLTFYAPSL